MTAGNDVCLSKWYLDCIGPRGNAWVGYRVELRWRALSVRFAGFTLVDGETPPRSRVALRRIAEPASGPAGLTWNAPGLALSGRWVALAERVDATVFESPEGSVEWRCLQPASRVRLEAGQSTMEGLGYAEQLVLTLPPWQLPISGLRWGRFVAEGHSLVWIDWLGAHRFRLLAHNGHRLPLGAISEASVASEDGSVSLDLRRHAVLRDAPLGETLGALLPKLPALPRRLLGLVEQKWIARGALTVAGRRVATGWAIHEQVTWPA